MRSLSDILNAPETREDVIRACAQVVQAEVDGKRGLSGVAIKAAFKVITAVKPRLVEDVVSNLLPDFSVALEPLYQASLAKAAESGADQAGTRRIFINHIEAHKDQAAEALLSVTDGKAQRSTNDTIRKTYEKLRKNAHEQVEAAVPKIAQAVAAFI